MRLPKRPVAFVLTALLAMGILTGCGAPSDTQTSGNNGDSSEGGNVVELEFWHTLTGDDGTVLGTMVDAFNNEHKDSIHVNVQAMNSSDFKAKVPMVIEAGEGIPDISVLTLGRLQSYAQQGLLKPMDEIIADMGLSSSDFAAEIWNAGTLPDGKRYSIPIDAHGMLMYYNEDILSELGYVSDDLQNIGNDQFVRMCEEAKEAGYVGVTIWWGWMDYMFNSYLAQNGGKTVSLDEPTKALFNTDLGAEDVDYFLSLYNAGFTNGMDVHPETMFQQGDALFCLTGTWTVSGMNAIEGLNWGLTYLPAWGEKNVIWGGSHNLAVFEKEHSPERLQAISTFIKWVSDHGADWAQSGQIPARIDVLESDEYKALPWSFAAEAIDRFIFAPPLVTASDITTAVDAYIYDYYLGNIPTAKEALDLAAAEGEAKAEGTLASMGAVD